MDARKLMERRAEEFKRRFQAERERLDLRLAEIAEEDPERRPIIYPCIEDYARQLLMKKR